MTLSDKSIREKIQTKEISITRSGPIIHATASFNENFD